MARAGKHTGRQKASSRKDGEMLGRRAEDFGEEAGRLGTEFCGRMGRHGRMAGCNFVQWHASPWSTVFHFVLNVICFAIGVWVLGWVAARTGVHVLGVLAAFFLHNFEAFILLFMLKALLRVLSHAGTTARQVVLPVRFGLSWAVFAWIASSVVVDGKLFSGNAELWDVAVFLNAHLIGVFAAFAILGYLGVLAGKHFSNEFDCCAEGDFVASKGSLNSKAKPVQSRITSKRLYRSGRERILGGVCGGIAEYFDADPTLVRLVWVLLSLAFGFGVLLYLIMWVITPRNPRDDWSGRRSRH